MRFCYFLKFACSVLFIVIVGVDAEDNFNQGLVQADKDFCNPNPCKNGASCMKYSKKCSCKYGYSGDYCEKCKCENGFCKEIDGGNSVCACRSEWGLLNPTKCKKCNCGKGFNCTFKDDWFSDGKICLCKAGYEDKAGFCEGTCNVNPCQNGGTCQVKEKNIECKCQENFSGDLCEIKVLSTTDPTPFVTTTQSSTSTYTNRTEDYTTPGSSSMSPLSSTSYYTNGTKDYTTPGSASMSPLSSTSYYTNGTKNYTNPGSASMSPLSSTSYYTNGSKDYTNPGSGSMSPLSSTSYYTNGTKDYTNPGSASMSPLSSTSYYTNGTKDYTTPGSASMSPLSSTSYYTNGTKDYTTLGSTTMSPLSSTHPTTDTTAPYKTTAPENNTTSPFLNTTTPENNITSSFVNTTTPENNTTSPFINTTTPENNTTATDNMTSPENNTTSSDYNTNSSLATTTTFGNDTDANTTVSGTTDGTSGTNATLLTDVDSTVSSKVTTEPGVTTSVKEEVTTPEDKDKCKNNPCKNGGTCHQDEHGVNCLCAYPYSGKICTDSYWCTEGLGKVLCGKAECTFDFENKIGRCICQKGEYYDYNKRECKVVDKCLLTPEKCKGANEICEDNECRCNKNFKRNEKKECVPNFCESSKNVCGPNITCHENPDDPENVKCVCMENEVFDGKQCLQVNKCHVPPFLGCQQICNATTETCDCYDGYILQKDKKSCEAKTAESNCSKDCKPGICYKDGENESCMCPPTHVSENGTCKVVDLCKTNKAASSLCPENACESHPTLGFRCKCEGLLTYDKNNVTCRRKRMCSEGGGHEICLKKSAKCVEDHNTEDGFRCDCAKHDEMDIDGICKRKCDLKKNQDKCFREGAVCEMDDSEAICKCPPLFTFSKDGRCEELASSSYTGYIPFVKDKYSMKTLFAPGKASIDPDYDKMRHDFRDSMRVLYGSNYKFADILSCSNETTSSLTCAVEVQFATEPENQVKLIGDSSTCIDNGPDTCFIPPQLVLLKESVNLDLLAQTDPCMDIFKLPICGCQQTVCSRLGENDTNFRCTCNKGFSSYGTFYPASDRRTVIQKCQDIDECLESSACPNSTECMNTHGSYECLCSEGHRVLEQKDDPKITGCVPICSTVKCGSGKCELYGSQYTCVCNDGYTGASCEKKLQIEEYPKGMEAALITLSTIVIPLVLFSIYMVHKYRIISKTLKSSGYLDDSSSTLSMQPLREGLR